MRGRLFGFVCVFLSAGAACAQAFPPEGGYSSNLQPARQRTSELAFASSVTTGEPVRQDVMVMYTQAALTKRGQAGIDSIIANSIAHANQYYATSGVNIVLNLVYSGLTTVTESTGMEPTLSRFEQDPSVRAIRDAYAADMAVILAENGDYCGWARAWVTSNGTVDAYAATSSGCSDGNKSFAHEIGHLQGLAHDRETDPNASPMYPYGYGYRVCASPGFRDVMSYPCTNGFSVARGSQFSTPLLTVNGYATGIDYTADPAHAADAARALNDSALAVAAFRVVPVPLPKPPTNVTVN